jgi:hypothetical protein
MFSGASIPPQAKGSTWSTTYPAQGPVRAAVNGQGCWAWNARRAEVLLGAVPVPGTARVYAATTVPSLRTYERT